MEKTHRTGRTRIIKTVRALSARGISIASTFALSLIVARSLDPREAGAFFVFLAFLVAASTLGRFGTDTYVLKQVAGPGVTRRQFAALAASCTVGSVAAGVLLGIIMPHVGGVEALAFSGILPKMAVAVAVAGNALVVFMGGIARGVGLMGFGMFLEAGAIPLITILLVGSHIRGHPTFESFIYLYSLAATAAVLLGVIAISQRKFIDTGQAVGGAINRASLFSMTVTATTFYLSTWAPVVVMGILRRPEDAAVYSVAARLAGFVNILPALQNTYLAPDIARRIHREDRDAVTRICRRAARSALLVGAPFAFVYLALPHYAVLLFGHGYESSSGTLRILVAGYIIVVMLGPVNPVLLTGGREHFASILNTALLLLTIVGLLLGVPRFGAAGAGVVSAAGLVSYALLGASVIHQKNAINTTVFSRRASTVIPHGALSIAAPLRILLKCKVVLPRVFVSARRSARVRPKTRLATAGGDLAFTSARPEFQRARFKSIDTHARPVSKGPAGVRLATKTTATEPKILGLWAPLVVVLIWWAICYGFYSFGWPIQYSQVNFWKVTALFAATVVATLAGFRAGVRRKPLEVKPPPEWWPWVGLILTVVTFIPTVRSYSGIQVGDISSALQNQAAAYQQTSQVISEGSRGRLATVIALTICAPFTMTCLPYFSMKFRDKKLRYRIALLVSLAVPLSISVLTGRNQQLAIASLTVFAIWLMSRYKSGRGVRIGATFCGVIAAVGFVSLVAARKVARLSGNFVCHPGQLNCTSADSGYFRNTVGTLASYGGQGFEGLGHALEGTWQFGGGYSHSPALRNLVTSLGLGNPSAQTITDQLQMHEWSDKAYWSTALAQLANDIPWILIPLVVGLTAFILGWLWLTSLTQKGFFTATAFSFMWIGFIFVPQNYQVGASGPTYVGFLLILMIIAHRNTRIRI